MLDTDSVFHGVARVGGLDRPPPLGRGGSELVAGDGGWDVVDANGERIDHHGFDDVRYSVSWKAYCFADDAERRHWHDRDDDLTLDSVLDALAADLADRPGGADDRPPADLRHSPDLGQRLIDTYIRFPQPTTT